MKTANKKSKQIKLSNSYTTCFSTFNMAFTSMAIHDFTTGDKSNSHGNYCKLAAEI